MRHFLQSWTALVLAGAMTISPVLAAGPIGDGRAPTVDEAYYATVDYYGNLTEGSVVKSYILNGADSITDYGRYDRLNNLTDSTEPTVSGERNTFRFSGKAPTHFYLEGKTAEPFRTLPWTLSVRYKLNGVPARAEDLAGASGTVEIDVDALRNPLAGDYARHNYTLEAMALFNQDDILSLEAPGAQVQLLGNLRAALFLCLPGEEGHFVIRVGTEDFQFGGLTFLMVPATLSQLGEFAKLGEKKEQLEDSYHKLSDSLDTLLNAMDGISGSLNTAAGGLDRLNGARGTISEGKGALRDGTDALAGDLEGLSAALAPMAEDMATAQQALSEEYGLLEQVTSDVTSLKEEMTGVSAALEELRGSKQALDTVLKDLGKLQTALESLREGKGDVKALLADLADMQESLHALRGQKSTLSILVDDLTQTEERLEEMEYALWGARGTRLDTIRLTGLDTAELKQGLAQEKKLSAAYAAAGGGTVERPAFLVTAMSAAGGYEPTQIAATAAAFSADPATPEAAVEPTVSAYVAALAPALGLSDEGTAAAVTAQAVGLFRIRQAVAGIQTATGTELSQATMETFAQALAAAMTAAGQPMDAETAGTYCAAVLAGNGLLAAYDAAAGGNGTVDDYPEFLTAMVIASGTAPARAAATVKELLALHELNQSGVTDAVLGRLSSMSAGLKSTVSDVNSSITTVNTLLEKLEKPTYEMVDLLRQFTHDADDLQELLDAADDLFKALEKLSEDLGKLDGTVDSADELIAALAELTGAGASLTGALEAGDTLLGLGRNASDKIAAMLDDAQAFYALAASYEPQALSALEKVGETGGILSRASGDAADVLRSTRDLLERSGADLDEGTRETLTGLAASLRAIARGLDTTGEVKQAKRSVSQLIEDAWSDYTGGVMDLLDMDAEAPAVSLTDPRNPSPQSVQVLIRTREIKQGAQAENEGTAEKSEDGQEEQEVGFWGRFRAMLAGLFRPIARLFGKEQ